MNQVTASIVLYHNAIQQLAKAINSFLKIDLKVKLYLIDNSSNDDLKELESIDSRIEYIFNNANLGYGTAHNIAMKKSIEGGVFYHVVLNPDIYFKASLLDKIFTYMEQNIEIGNLLPQVLYPDGEVQHLCKLLPTPIDLIFRRFIPSKSWQEKRNNLYELRFSGYDNIMNVPSLSGCFMFLRVAALKDTGIFDENIFMYLEDFDLNRRIHYKYKTIFYPKVNIIHEHAKESYQNKKLLIFHIKSAIYYFNKWGWFFDKKRDDINKAALKKLQKPSEK